MALKKRGKTWHCHFVVNGQRIRQSLETKDWREAQAKEKELIAQVSEGKVHRASISPARQSFAQAADEYETGRKTVTSKKTRKKLSAATLEKEKFMLIPLRLYFKQQPLKNITAERIKAYLLWRESPQEVKVGKDTRVLSAVGPATQNAELGVLRRILKAAKLWARVSDEITPLEEPETIGRALTDDEQRRLLRTASMKPEWETAYLAAVIALSTTRRAGDLKPLRWSHIDLFDRTVTIWKSKTKAGEKTIPLTPRACAAFARLRERAESFGPVEPSHYVFASHGSRQVFDGNTITGAALIGFDPTKPVKCWRTAWRKLTKQAGLPGFRFHDLRHTAITILAESGVSDSTIKAIAGHVSNRMLERYSHIRMEAKRKAVEVLQNGAGMGGYDTNHDTNPAPVTARPV
jgi:integrase